MKAKKLLMNLAIFLLSAFIIVYILVQLISTLTTDVSYQYAEITNADDTLEKNGYLFRSESVLFAEREGIINYAVKESQKLGVDQLVATVFDSEQGVDIQKQISKIDEKISVLEHSSVDSSYLTSDVSKIDGTIYNALIKSKLAVYENDIYLTQQYKEDLLTSFNKRELITTGNKSFDEQIQALQDERNRLTSSLQNPLCSVYSKNSGYFSTLLDGYESVFTPQSLDGMTVDSFRELIHSDPTQYGSLAVGKIVTDFHWYTLCEVTKKEAEDFQIGASYSVSYLYSSGQQLNAVLEKKITQTDSDAVVLVFVIEEFPSDFDYTRQQTIRIVKEAIEGISFPRSALRMLDGVQGVYVIEGNSVAFKKVEIIYTTDTHYISREMGSGDEDSKSYLSRFDRVITEGKDLYVGKVLD